MINDMMTARQNQDISSLVDNFHVAYPDYPRLQYAQKNHMLGGHVGFDYSSEFL